MARESNPGERRGDHQGGATSPLSKAPPDPAPSHLSSPYNEELATEICKLLADGMPLRVLFKHPKFPGFSTFWCWLKEHKDFAAKYALAQEIKIKRLPARVSDIVNARVPDKDGKIDWSLPPPPLDKGTLAHIKLQVATRKWLLANMPKR